MRRMKTIRKELESYNTDYLVELAKEIPNHPRNRVILEILTERNRTLAHENAALTQVIGSRIASGFPAKSVYESNKPLPQTIEQTRKPSAATTKAETVNKTRQYTVKTSPKRSRSNHSIHSAVSKLVFRKSMDVSKVTPFATVAPKAGDLLQPIEKDYPSKGKRVRNKSKRNQNIPLD